MAARGDWSAPIRLRDYADASDRQGIYEIGFLRNDVFGRKYIGRAAGESVTIRNRLSKHFRGKGSRNVAVYYKVQRERDNLYCRWKHVSNPKSAEAELLAARGMGRRGYSWNARLA